MQELQRGRTIIEMRARERPVAWKVIGSELKISPTYAQEIHRRALSWEEPLHDPMLALQETIDSVTAAVHAAWDTYREAEEGSSVRVQAIRAALDATGTRLHIMQLAGRAPRSLAGPSMASEMRSVFVEFADLLRRHGVPSEALEELIAMAESRMGQGAPATPGLPRPA